MRFWDQVELVPAVTTTDTYGTPLRAPDLQAPPVLSGAVVQFAGSTDNESSDDEREGQRVNTAGRAFLPAGTSIDAFGYLRWMGTLYELHGDPMPAPGPRGVHHLEVRLRKVR